MTAVKLYDRDKVFYWDCDFSLVFWSLCVWDLRFWLWSELRLQCYGMWHHVHVEEPAAAVPRDGCVCAVSTFAASQCCYIPTVPCGVGSQETVILLILLLLQECICIFKHICSFTFLPIYTFVYVYLFFFCYYSIIGERNLLMHSFISWNCKVPL
jgi:hypothetical protein